MLALIAVLVAGVPLATGASAFTVTGSAMEPGLPAGALVVTRPVDAHHLDVGDVIVAPEQILGRLWYSIPVLGWVNIAVAGPFRFALVPAVAAAICAYATLVLVARSRRRRTAS
jgi:signal peptidase